MRKKCYSLTYLGPNVNGGSDFRINSQIWLNAVGPRPLNNLELLGFCIYLESELQRVWSTATNPGLSSGNGPYVYNGTKDTFTCSAPTGTPAHSRDTGIVVKPISDRTPHAILPNIRKRQNEIIFDVFRDRPPNKREYVDPKKQEGELYYYKQPPLGVLPVPPPQFIAYSENDIQGNVDGDAYYLNVHNTAAHEFGHALGLADRYHYLAFGYHSGSNANLEGANKSQNWIVRHGGGDVPMYLPGFYDKTISNDGSTFYIPPYDQAPYGTGSPTPTNAGKNTPQPDFDLNEPGHMLPYDIDYTSRFGWEHNIMSKKIGINDPGGLGSNNRFNGQYSSVGLNAYTLYNSIYSAEMVAGAPEIVLITETQVKVITDTGGSLTDLPSIGGEIISKRFEDERAKDEGYPSGMFDQFVFIIGANETMSGSATTSPFVGQQVRDPSERGIPAHILEDILNITPNVAAANRAFYNSKSGGTFIGLLYTSELNRNGDGAKIVCDWEFNHADYGGILGIADCMDYRISTMETNSGINLNKWSPKFWEINLNASGLDHFYGFMNPGIGAKGNPKSDSRSFVLGLANAGVVVKNIELQDLNNTLFFNIIDDVYSRSFPGFFSDGLETINYLTLTFGSTDPMRFVQRILLQAQRPFDTSIMNGKFATTDGLMSFTMNTGDDIFANVGIATEKARSIWNGSRNDDHVPSLPNPRPATPLFVPAPIQEYDPDNLPPNYPINNGISVTPWTFQMDIGEHTVKYIISFILPSPLPAGFVLLPKYEMLVRNFSNREIIEIMTLPS